MYGRTPQRGASWYRVFLLSALDLVALAVLLALVDPPVLQPYRAPFTIAALVLLVVSSTCYLLAPAFSSAERARARAAYGTHRDVLANVTAAIAWGNLVFLPALLLIVTGAEQWQTGPLAVLQTTFERIGEMPPLVVFLALVGLDLALILVIYTRLLLPGATTRTELGLVGSHLSRNVALGILAALVILLASGVIGYAMSQFGVRQTQAEQLNLRHAPPTIFYLILAAGALLAPIAEEMFFRGYVFRAYLTSMGPLAAYLISAALFGILHLNLPAFLPLAVIGIILAFAFRITGSLVPAIVAHGLNNALALLLVYYVAGMP